MTKKDFDLVAACIGGALADSRNSQETILDVARRLNCEFRLANPRFDTEKFFARVYYWRKSHGGVS